MVSDYLNAERVFFLKQTNLIKITLESIFEQIIINKIMFNRLNFADKK